MILVGLVSSYREGRLLRGAVDSLRDHVDHVFVFEGSAGMPVSAEAPESELPREGSRVTVEHGAWATDAAKRTAIVKRVNAAYPGEAVWGVWVDGDEVLVNGAFLFDLLQAVVWRGDDPPVAGYPIRLVEMDGAVVVCRAKVLRIDLVANYVVSSSGIRFKNGIVQAEGNLPDRIGEWWVPERMAVLERGDRMMDAPLPGEPILLHRSPLRHPARVGVRMHVQEGEELKKLGVILPT